MKNKFLKISFWLSTVVVLTFAFQAGHFIEHLAQFLAWVFGPKNTVYMTPWATDIVEWIAGYFPEETLGQARRIGVELLHLVGNLIFLIGICAYYYFDKSKNVKIAFWFQLVHVLEHTALTVTILTTGSPIGMSTLFGLNSTSISWFIGYRIVWHFIINLIPTWFIAKALWLRHKKKTISE